jgi:glucokinase
MFVRKKLSVWKWLVLGEATYGAGKNFNIVAYLTVSTGVGGARIVNQKLDEKSIGFEPGKQIIDVKESKTLENLISGRGLEERFNMKAKDISNPVIWQELANFLGVGLNNIIVEWSPEVVVLGGSMILGNPSISLEKAEEKLKEIFSTFSKTPPVKKAELGDFGGLWGALALLKQLQIK